MEAYALKNEPGDIEVDSVDESYEAVKHRVLEQHLGWRYQHPDRYPHDEAWKQILKTAKVVKVVVLEAEDLETVRCNDEH